MLTENIILEETNMEQSAQKGRNVNNDNILNEIKSFKKFQVEVESKLCLLEDTIIAGKEAKEITNDSSGYIVNVFERQNFIFGESFKIKRCDHRISNKAIIVIEFKEISDEK